MTDRLYYTDAYLAAFDAVVVSVEASEAGIRIRLDRTAFYPTSGGQPFDTGVLAGVRIGDVVDEDGDVVHLAAIDLAGAAAAGLAAGRTVHGAIDWDRRFDHMQQHIGQHVLSSAIDRRLAPPP
jgi:alanyl-tRNA synthetase